MQLGGVTIGLREALIALIALVALYMLFVLLRVRRMRPLAEEVAEAPDEKAEETSTADFLSTRPRAERHPRDEDEQVPLGSPTVLAEHILNQGLEREVAQLRDEVDAVRGELAALREDMLREMAHLRASQTVSPIYGDAMQMAVAGYEATMIAERCGIARAEAELVVALAKSQER